MRGYKTVWEAQHKNARVTKCNSYCLFVEEQPKDKNKDTKKYVVMRSYFLKLGGCGNG